MRLPQVTYAYSAIWSGGINRAPYYILQDIPRSILSGNGRAIECVSQTKRADKGVTTVERDRSSNDNNELASQRLLQQTHLRPRAQQRSAIKQNRSVAGRDAGNEAEGNRTTSWNGKVVGRAGSPGGHVSGRLRFDRPRGRAVVTEPHRDQARLLRLAFCIWARNQ